MKDNLEILQSMLSLANMLNHSSTHKQSLIKEIERIQNSEKELKVYVDNTNK